MHFCRKSLYDGPYPNDASGSGAPVSVIKGIVVRAIWGYLHDILIVFPLATTQAVVVCEKKRTEDKEKRIKRTNET